MVFIPQYLWNTNFFDWCKDQEDHTWDAIITDPPYTSFRNKLGENFIKDKSFDIELFCSECCRLLKKDGIFISFCSILLLRDYFFYFKDKLRFRCEQIWDKRPTRSWISYGMPLRHIEYIVYFGEGKLDFRFGERKKKYNRTSFGGILRDTDENTKDYAESQYEQILDFKLQKKDFKVPKQRNIGNLTNTLQKYIQIDDKNNKNKYNENYNNYLHPTKKPAEFSDLFKNIIGSSKNVLDPCCGTGALICTFENNSLGIDIKEWQPVKPKMNHIMKIDRFF